MIRTGRRALALSVALATAGLALAAPAQASIDDCAAGDACLWTNAYYNTQAAGDRWQWPDSVNTLPSWIDNKASSARNNGQHCRADFYTGTYHTGNALTMQLQDHRDNLALDPRAGGGTWNDVISSLQWVC